MTNFINIVQHCYDKNWYIWASSYIRHMLNVKIFIFLKYIMSVYPCEVCVYLHIEQESEICGDS